MSKALTSSGLHYQLRQATKLPHHALDHHPLLAPLVKPDLTIIQYGNALAALHGVFALAEAAILAFLERRPGLFDYDLRRKLPALDSDLATLGREPIAPHTDFPSMENIGALIGVLYTVEGATQGGQVIARTLRQIPDVSLPLKFFSGYGDLSRQRWEEFLQFADARCPVAESTVAVATAARFFAAIKTHLDDAQGRLLIASFQHTR